MLSTVSFALFWPHKCLTNITIFSDHMQTHAANMNPTRQDVFDRDLNRDLKETIKRQMQTLSRDSHQPRPRLVKIDSLQEPTPNQRLATLTAALKDDIPTHPRVSIETSYPRNISLYNVPSQHPARSNQTEGTILFFIRKFIQRPRRETMICNNNYC